MLRFAQRIALRAALALLAVTNLLEAPPARSQHLGDVSLTTTTQILANNVTCTGNPQNFFAANLGQSFHLATAAIVSGGGSFGMEVDGIDAVNNVFKLSNPQITVGTASFLVQASGFMPIIRVQVLCTVGSNFSLSYSGSFAQNTINAGAPGSGGLITAIGGNVQGVVPTGQNGAPIFPVIGGYVQPAINAGTVQYGVDTFAPRSVSVPNGASGTFSVSPPVPSAPGEWGLAIFDNTSIGTVNSFLGPWSCITSSCIGTNQGTLLAQLNLGVNNNLSVSVTNALATRSIVADFVLFNKAPTVRQFASGNQVASQATPGATVAGSTVIFAVSCTTLTCTIAPTDSQGNTLRQINLFQVATAGVQAISAWILGPTSAAAETVTFNAAAGTTIGGSAIIELTGTTPGNLTNPSAPLVGSNNRFTSGEDDPGGVFVEHGGYDFTQTLTISTASTNTFNLWSQSQNGLFSTCSLTLRITAITGVATTLNTFLQDSADQIGWNDRLSLTQGTTAAGAQNLLGSIAVFTAGNLTATANSAVVSTDGALAAGSGIAGQLGPFGRIKFVTTGAAVSVTVTFNVACR